MNGIFIHVLTGWKVLLMVMFLTVASGCDQKNTRNRSGLLSDPEETESWKTKDYPEIHIDLKDIRERGKLIAITSYSSTSYFIFRGKPMGYEYELLHKLAKHLEVDLEIRIADNMNHIIDMLLSGEGDLISYGLTVTRERKKKLAFTEYHTKTHQVLVQRKPTNWRRMKRHIIDEQLIRDPLELIGKTVHIRKQSSYYERMQNLMEEIGGEITIEPVSGELETEELIKLVAEGEIDYTIADYNIAAINATYFDNIDIKTNVSFNQRIAWALRETSPELLEEINNWIKKMRRTTDYYVIYNKYFKNRKDFRKRKGSEYYSKSGSKISPFDDLLKEHAGDLGWDWRLLASLVYQESRFDPDARSWAGAIGLMQIMPLTAKHVGSDNPLKPEANIEAGVSYLKELQEQFGDIPDSLEQIKFVLAAYNVGPNHVEDARRLATKYKDNPDIWTNHVENWILKKSKSKYYSDDVVKFGYCRGSEPYKYVREILERYEQYQIFIKNQSKIVSNETTPGKTNHFGN